MKNIFTCFFLLLISSQLAQADIKSAAKAMKEKDYKTALREYGKEADKGNPDATFQMGRIFATKESGFFNLNSSFKWNKQAADLKNEYASYLTGVFYYSGTGTTKDVDQAKKYLKFAADESVINAKVALAEIAMFEKDYFTARKWLNNFVESTVSGKLQKKIGEVNSAKPLFTLAVLSLDGLGGPVDVTTAEKYFSEFAANGVPDAQYAMARILSDPKNTDFYEPNLALTWAITAKANGFQKADEFITKLKNERTDEELKQSLDYFMEFYRLSLKSQSIMARAGKPRSGSSVKFGVSKIIKRPYDALDWLDEASAENFPNAGYMLALLYARGDTVNKRIDKAVTYYRRAAEIGNLKAMKNLANILMNNQNGHQNFEEARKWLSILVENKDRDAAKSLGRLYYTGRGGDQSILKSEKMYKFAAMRGNVEAQSALEGIYSNRNATEWLDYEKAYYWDIISDINGTTDSRFTNYNDHLLRLTEDQRKKIHDKVKSHYEKRLVLYNKKTLDRNNEGQVNSGAHSINNHILARIWLEDNNI